MLRLPVRDGLTMLGLAGAAFLVLPELAIPVTFAAAVAIVGYELGKVRGSLVRRLDQLEADIAQTQPLLQLQTMLATRRPLPAMTGYAIAPDFGVMLAQLVADEKPELVVETGSGVSTVIVAYALEKLGRGKVIALEHDPDYARRTRELLALHGLERFAQVVDAPLMPVEVGGATYHWYALDALPAGQIDMVIDDGPPRYAGDMLRYASLPLLSRRLSQRGLFVLDVVGDEERTILERWKRELPEYRQERLPTKKGNVVIQRM
jgi:predicted O-methyltransferase YrrM